MPTPVATVWCVLRSNSFTRAATSTSGFGCIAERVGVGIADRIVAVERGTRAAVGGAAHRHAGAAQRRGQRSDAVDVALGALAEAGVDALRRCDAHEDRHRARGGSAGS